MTLCFLLATVINAQQGQQRQSGAPLKGVDVKPGRNPGGGAAARVPTDDKGNFIFPVLPAGGYTLTIELDRANAKNSALKDCDITVKASNGKEETKGYDLTEN